MALVGLLLAGCQAAAPAQPQADRDPRPVARATPTITRTPTPTPPPQLPRGGRRVFPEHRLVGYAGGSSGSFGRLTIETIDKRAAEIEKLGRQYTAEGRAPLPIFELIAVVAHAKRTETGLYRTYEPSELVDAYLTAARKHKALLLLNIQPGRADFIDDVRAFERWLRQPDVGLALDPEWAVGPGQVPGQVIGSTSGTELDSIAAYLSTLVRKYNLPEKVMVYHQFHVDSVADEAALRAHPGVVLIKSIDGVGAAADKVATWRRLMKTLPPDVHTGFKLFFDEDTRSGPLMTPAEVLALRPQPSYVLYE